MAKMKSVRVKSVMLMSALVSVLLLAAAAANSDGRSSSPAGVTFSKDVAPILYKNCASCHRPGEIAPMSLLSYKEARPWAKSIKEKVVERVMPPWHADPAYGHFKNDRRLSQKDIDTITAWVDGGAKEGNVKDLPPLPRFTEGWQMGKPDLVLSMLQDFDVPAEGVVDYKYFVIPTNFTQDRWVQAAEVRPGNRAVVHHVIVFVAEAADLAKGAGALARGQGLSALTGTAPGELPTLLPEGIGKLVKAGSYLVLQMHYTPNGIAQKDRTSVGLVFNKTPVHKGLNGGAAMNRGFAIPPGADNHQVASAFTFREDSHILNLMPHMHLRGKSFEYRLIYPDGTAKVILSVPRYDFNWQTRYELSEPIAAPKGSRLECVAKFDNSAKNRFNPDPAKTVRWGPQTWDEMMIGFVGFTLDKQELVAPAVSSK